MLEIREEDGRTLCVFSGRMDTVKTGEVGNELAGKVDPEKLPIVFEMDKVDYVASSFLRLCLEYAKRGGKARFRVTGLVPNVKKVFKIAGFDKIMTIE